MGARGPSETSPFTHLGAAWQSHEDDEVQLIADLPQCSGAESLLLTIHDGVLDLSGTIEFGDRESPRLYELTLGGFARMFRLNPNVAWDRVTGTVEEGIFCIRIRKEPNPVRNRRRRRRRKSPRQFSYCPFDGRTGRTWLPMLRDEKRNGGDRRVG
jgi:HSP20 family molecular chaperone IbpA